MSLPPIQVLLVEDTDDLRTLYSRLLRRRGFQVREARNGQEALDQLHDPEPDLVLTDIMMPVLDGIALIRRIRSMPALSGVPVLAVTGGGTEIERQAREAGAIDVLPKPLELPLLLDRLAPYQFRVSGGRPDGKVGAQAIPSAATA